MNLLDKAKGYLSPKYAMESAKFRSIASLYGNGLYDGATQSPHYDINIFGTTEQSDLYDLETLRNTSRQKYKNNGFYTGVIEAATDHVIGAGLRAKSTIQKRAIPGLSEDRAKEIEIMFDDYFNSWADSTISDVTAKDNFYQMQRLAYQIYKKDGDSFCSLPLTRIGSKKVIQISLIASENITTNKISFENGIKLSSDGMPLSYSILQKDNTHKEITAFSKGKRNILHVFSRKRAKIARGIPFLSPVMRDIDAIDQYMKHEILAAKLGALFFGSIETDSTESTFGDGELDLTASKQVQKSENTVKENSITQLNSGDKLNIHQKGRENPNFKEYIYTNFQKVSTHTRIPLEIILAQFVSSYSASRAAMLQMTKFTNPERTLFVNSFCKPTRDQVITWGIMQGDLIVPDFFENKGAYLKAMWIGSPMGSVDPAKDVKAKILAVDGNLCTREQATEELGFGDFEQNVDVLSKEKELLLQKKLIKAEAVTNG
jgi:lambda family phage portal protein